MAICTLSLAIMTWAAPVAATSALKTCGEASLTARNEAAGTCCTTGDECLDACTQ
jgi:hypothetical protein